MKKTITFNIPEGYIVDKENSTNKNIVLKLAKSERVTTWEEYCKKMEGKDSYYINSTRGGIISSKFGVAPIVSEFDNKEDAEAFAALSKLLKLRKDWVGDWKPDWKAFNDKYVIGCVNDNISKTILCHLSQSLSFPTKKMRDEFFNTFQDILEIAKPLL